jgi:class 3 adenylate cyclase
VLCPLCRGVKESVSTLSLLKPTIHCEACNIDSTANFDRSVEITFNPGQDIRPRQVSEFCVGSPQLTPHIVAQQLLQPNETRALRLPLEAGRYRLRALEMAGGQALIAAKEGVRQLTLAPTTDGWRNDEPVVTLMPDLTWQNPTGAQQLFILERLAWSDTAVTAAEVTALQTFRDLFANEALRPGERISVGSLTLLFTDLRNSTSMYRDAGDAVAFGRVMDHFDILRDAIAAENGGIVKTIGDSVMGVFVRPVYAVRAILQAQRAIAQAPQPLQLKAGLHFGPCIAVNLNDRLDYFGSTVNIAARLERFSTLDDIVISDSIYNDLEVRLYLQEMQSELTVEAFTSQIKGFGGEEFELWRIKWK